MWKLFIIQIAIITMTACANVDYCHQSNLGSIKETMKSNSENEDSTVVLNPNPDSTNYSGSVTKITYPTKRHFCQDSLTNYSFECLGNRLEIHLPCYYLRTEYLQYTEGQILTIFYPDSSTISILCGTQANLSIDEKKTNERYSKKVVVSGYQFTYTNVPKNKMHIFNKAFDLLNKDIR
jgi:hypothetical protein